MFYRTRESLTVIELWENEKNISFDRLKKILLDRPSNIIYCEKNEKLLGIVSMIDICRAENAGKDYAVINSNPANVRVGEYMQARRIFAERKNIHSLPILTEDGKLAGDWLKWDSLYVDKYKFVRNEQSIWFRKDVKLAFIYPGGGCKSKFEVFEMYCNKLLSFGVELKKIKCTEVLEYADSVDWILTIDEDECEAISTLYCHILDRRDIKGKFQSISNLNKIVNQELVESYLIDMSQKGVHILNLIFSDSGYSKDLRKRISDKFAGFGKSVSNGMTPAMYPDFFDDMRDEKYVDSIMQLRFPVENKDGQVILRDYCSPLYNVTDGERCTIAQPEKYKKTIYFIGPCFIYGRYVEDKNTIESLLQKKINEDGYEIKVVNCGCPVYSYNIEFVRARLMDLSIKKGDIIVVYLFERDCKEIPKLDLNIILEKYNASEKWMVDQPTHCNHKINALYAKAIYDEVHSILGETAMETEKLIEQDKEYIKSLYLNRYFPVFSPSDYNKIGSIVMNCNPFTYGHRHLIERAFDIVDFLIIFVVEEDKSVFSFGERFAMVCEGVSDLKNIMVVPSGPFILSQTTFPEYFVKAKDEYLKENVINDITFFAEKIAPQLKIKYRFAGEEPDDGVTNEYNMAMKCILPGKGIDFIEIPRKKQGGNYISASKAREYLGQDDLPGFNILVPESTTRLLFGTIVN